MQFQSFLIWQFRIIKIYLFAIFAFILQHEVHAQQRTINHWESEVLANDSWKFWVETTSGSSEN